RVGDDPIEGATGEEDVDHAGNDDADQAHDEEPAQAGQVDFGDIADEAHAAEHAGGDGKGNADIAQIVSDKDDRECQAVDRRIQQEQGGGDAGADLVHGVANSHDQAEFNHDEKNERAAIEDGAEG